MNSGLHMKSLNGEFISAIILCAYLLSGWCSRDHDAEQTNGVKTALASIKDNNKIYDNSKRQWCLQLDHSTVAKLIKRSIKRLEHMRCRSNVRKEFGNSSYIYNKYVVKLDCPDAQRVRQSEKSNAVESFPSLIQKKLPSEIVILPTPILKLGTTEFYGNDFLDYVIFDVFFRKERHCNFSSGKIHDDFHDGIFLETGASNGIHASNSLYFERYLNWKGLLIEPSASAICQLPFNRPEAINYQGAACAVEGILTDNKFCGRNQAPLSCLSEDAFNKPVRCSPLQSYIDDSQTKTRLPAAQSVIDFMSIDVEEFYMQALLGMDFKKTFVRVLLIECKADDCYRFLENNGFQFIKAGHVRGIGKTDVIAWRNG